jgi:hypothetical protein
MYEDGGTQLPIKGPTTQDAIQRLDFSFKKMSLAQQMICEADY